MIREELAFRELGPPDNEALLKLSRDCPIQGALTVRFDRSPDFFAWAHERFPEHMYVGAFDGARLVGCVMGGLKEAWLEGEWRSFAYLSDARVHPDYRGRRLTMRLIEELISRDPEHTRMVLGIVMGGNRAMQAVADAWEGPRYAVLGQRAFDIATIPLLRRPRRTRHLTVRTPEVQEAERLGDWLESHLPSRTLAPRMTAEVVRTRWADTQLAAREEWLVAERAGQVVGAAAFCDEDRLRRLVVESYAPLVVPLKGLVRGLSWMVPGLSPLPPAGEVFRRLLVRWHVVDQDDPAILRALLVEALHRFHGQGYHGIQIALAMNDPLRPALRGLVGYRTPSHLVVMGAPGERVVPHAAVPFIDQGTF